MTKNNNFIEGLRELKDLNEDTYIFRYFSFHKIQIVESFISQKLQEAQTKAKEELKKEIVDKLELKISEATYSIAPIDLDNNKYIVCQSCNGKSFICRNCMRNIINSLR